MSWISVHDTVKGWKLNSLAKEIGCSSNEALGLLVNLWLWAFTKYVNQDGLLRSVDRADLAKAVRESLDERYSAEQVVEALVSVGWIDEVAERLYIHDWAEWQSQYYKMASVREKDRKRQADYRARQAGASKGQSAADSPSPKPANADSSESKASPPPPPTQEVKKKATKEYSTGFEEFWSAYPRKTDKGAAYKCYNARLKDGWSPQELLEAARSYAAEAAQRHTEERYIKHAKTFLSADTPFAQYVRREAPGQQGFNEEDPFADWNWRQ